VERVLEVNHQFHLIEIKHLEENDDLSGDYKAKSKEVMNLIQTIYTSADQPTR